MHLFEETKKSPKPGPCEWVTLRSQSLNVSTALGGTEVACEDRVVQAGRCSSPAKDHGHVPSLSKLWFRRGNEEGVEAAQCLLWGPQTVKL